MSVCVEKDAPAKRGTRDRCETTRTGPGMNATMQRDVARTVVNRVAATRGLDAPWPETDTELPGWLDDADVTAWGVVELGDMRLRLAYPRQRDTHGMVYTPPEVVGFQVRAALPQARLDRLAGDPRPLEHITIHDPFVGCGIYLVHAARHLTAWALRCADALPEVDTWVRHAVTAQVFSECLYGSDLDGIAIDIAKSVCWLEIGGTRPITFMDDNLAVCDTFADQLPPGLAKRWPIDKPGGPAYDRAVTAR
jgi:hypothetical protein